MKTLLIAGTSQEPRSYKVTGNGELDSLKISRTNGQSAAEPLNFLKDGEGSTTMPLWQYIQVDGNRELPESNSGRRYSLNSDENQRSFDRFYVYVYLNPLKPREYKYGSYKFDYEPFYVGKGLGNRYKMHLFECKRGENKHKDNTIKSILNSGLKPIIKLCLK